MVGIFGLRGELKLDPSQIGTDSLAPGVDVVVERPDGADIYRVRALRTHLRRLLLAFEGVNDATAAQPLVGGRLWIARDAVRLGPGEHLDADLIGCTLVDPGGSELGVVVDVAHYPGSDMLVIGATRALVPLVREFVRSVDSGARKIVVDLPAGLLDDRLAEVDQPGD